MIGELKTGRGIRVNFSRNWNNLVFFFIGAVEKSGEIRMFILVII